MIRVWVRVMIWDRVRVIVRVSVAVRVRVSEELGSGDSNLVVSASIFAYFAARSIVSELTLSVNVSILSKSSRGYRTLFSLANTWSSFRRATQRNANASSSDTLRRVSGMSAR